MTTRSADIPDRGRSSASVGYRPDIDGLRAIAIVAVLLFHAFPLQFPGGFIGVDVFFVISGFLITGNISRSISTHSFTIGGFYLKRVRRIFPALITVLTVCLIVGLFVLTPSELTKLGRDTAAAAGFVSNLVYWAESGYFDEAAITKPLLHLWSLGIEEQFYIVWPLLMQLGLRLKKGRELALLIVVTSFALCVMTTAPQSSSAFFSPATRMWELGAGGLIALFSRKEDVGATPWDFLTPKRRMRLAELGSFVGLVLILGAIYLLDGGAPYPGWRALLPSLGAALIIAADKSSLLNRYVLSNPSMVFIGLISYPLYLWHWPVLSFAHTIQLGIVPVPMIIGLLALSAALATGTYLFIERPIHHTTFEWPSGRRWAASLLTIGLCGGALFWNRGAVVFPRTPVDLAKSGPGLTSEPAAPTSPVADSANALDQRSSSPENLKEPPEAASAAETSGAKAIAPKALVDEGDTGRASGSEVVRPSALERYQARVAAAMKASGDPNAYLVQMVSSRLQVVRTGICEYVDQDAPWPDPTKDRSTCETPKAGAKNVLVLGDSIASDTYASLHAAHPGFNVIQSTGIGCNLQRTEEQLSKPCIATLRGGKEIALSPDIKLHAVVLASLWNIRSVADLANSPTGSLIDALVARGRKVILIGPPVGFTILARDLIDKCPRASKDGITATELDRCAREHSGAYREINKAMKDIAKQKGIPFVDLHEIACNDLSCPILDPEGQLLYTDSWHRSAPGANFLGSKLREDHILERALGGR